MPLDFAMPDHISYQIRRGLPVFMSQAQHMNKRAQLPKTVLFVLHDTGGEDSRQELYDSDRRVSVHYLIGEYPGYTGPIVIKYMSEFGFYANGCGYGKLGGFSRNLNEYAVQFEIELGGMNDSTLDAYAATVGQSLRLWREQGCDVVIVGHKHIDARKSDPRFNWNQMVTSIYQYAGQL